MNIATVSPKQLVEKAAAKGKVISLEQAEALLNRAKAAAGAEAGYIKKYGKGSGYINKQGMKAEVDIVKGSYTDGSTLTKELREDGTLKFEGKMVVKIKCAHDGCKEERWVATSDLQNVNRCKEHAKEWRAKDKKRGGKRATASANLEAAEFLAELMG